MQKFTMRLSNAVLLAVLLVATPDCQHTATAPAAFTPASEHVRLPLRGPSCLGGLMTRLLPGPTTWLPGPAASAWWLVQWGLRSDGASGPSSSSTGGGGWGARGAWGAAAASLPAGDGGGSQAGAGGGGEVGVCSDTCELARNGICEDGSNVPGIIRGNGSTSRGFSSAVGLQVACDFGTDCTDCGPYKGVLPLWGTDAGFKGPIDFLRRQGVKVWARRVVFEPLFVFGYTDPTEDLDVSEQLERAGCMELGIVQVFREVLGQRCGAFRVQGGQSGAAGDAGPPLVVDVGANFGYFTVYAALLGCRVIAVEPVPRFLAFLHWNLAANGLQATTAETTTKTATGAGSSTSPQLPRVTVVDRMVSTLSGMNITMAAPRRGVWGTASAASMGTNFNQDLEMFQVVPAKLDDIIGQEQVLLLKVDVEGYEPIVFNSAERLLAEHRAEHIVMEYTPGMPEVLMSLYDSAKVQDAPVLVQDPPKMLLKIIRHGYYVVQLPDNFAKSGYEPQVHQPIPGLQEVLEQSVMYDLADVERFRNYSKAGIVCPWPSELRESNAIWNDGCLRAPDDAHPKGLRVMFSYNTNLWAARNRSMLNIGGPVGLFGPDQDEASTWWSQREPNQGVANRACPYLPPDQLVRSRCNCTKREVCGAEQDALLRALAEGRMPLPPRLPAAGAVEAAARLR